MSTKLLIHDSRSIPSCSRAVGNESRRTLHKARGWACPRLSTSNENDGKFPMMRSEQLGLRSSGWGSRSLKKMGRGGRPAKKAEALAQKVIGSLHLAALRFIRAQMQSVQLASYDERLLTERAFSESRSGEWKE